MLESGDYSDLELRCESRTWKVHSAVIKRAQLFPKACDANIWVRNDFLKILRW